MEKNLAITNAIQNAQTNANNNQTFDEVLSAKKTVVESAISAFNASTKPATEYIRIKNLCADLDTFVRDTRLKGFEKAFHTLDRVTFMKLFLNERTYTGYRIAQNPKSGELSLKEADRAITEKTMRTFLNKKDDENSVAPTATYEIAANPVFWKHLPMFYDNILRYMAESIGTIAPKMNEDAMKQYSAEYREKEGYPVATSLTKLAEQLNALVKEFLPEGLEIKLNSFDVKALSISLSKAKRMKFDLSNSDVLLDNILFALEIRMNGKKYEITSRDKNYKAKD